MRKVNYNNRKYLKFDMAITRRLIDIDMADRVGTSIYIYYLERQNII